MPFNSRFAEALARLPDYLGSHILVSLVALAFGLGVSLPLAIVAVRRTVLRNALLAIASVLQTIPGLALLALFYPLHFPHSAFYRPCWRWRSIRCCRCCATP
jgi:ABC-type proline/glycine betaine transport system permease subunit